VRFALHDRTTAPPFCAFAGTSTITLSDSEDLRNDYILYSEWTNIAGNIREGDVGRGNFHLLYNGNYLKVSQTLDLETGEMIMCQELWTSLPIWETQTEHNAVAMPYLLVATIKSGEGTGLMIRLGDYCQGVVRLDGFGLHVERWKRVTDKEGKRVWEKTRQSTKRRTYFFQGLGCVEMKGDSGTVSFFVRQAFIRR
jgi:hypothetical protein